MNKNIVFAFYGLPCLILYFFTVLSVISIRKKLSSSFVVIYVWTALVNFVTYLNAWISLRLTHEQWFHRYYDFANATGFLSIVHQLLISYLYFAQNINSFLLTLDRFFAIVAALYYGMWKRYFLLFGIILYLITITIGYWQIIGGLYSETGDSPLASFVYIVETREFVGELNIPEDSKKYASVLQVAFGILMIVSCVTFSAISWNRLRHLKTPNHADRSVFFISLCIFVSQSLCIMILIANFYFYFISFNIEVLMFIYTVMIYTSDVFSLGPGIYTLLVPGPIRRRFISLVTCGFNKPKRVSHLESGHNMTL